MATILFDIFPATGHYNASFLLAGKLAQDNRVVFACDGNFQQTVKNNGFEVYPLEETCLPAVHVVRRVKGVVLSFFENLYAYFLEDRTKLARKWVKNHLQMYRDIDPDIIILDSHHFYKVVIYNLFEIKVVRLQSMLTTQKNQYIPPLCFGILPLYTFCGTQIANLLWSWQNALRTLKLIFDKMLFARNDMLSQLFILSKYTDFQIEEHLDINRYSPWGIEFKGYPEIVLPPYPFEFPIKEKHFFSLKSHLKETRNVELFSARYNSLVHFISENRNHYFVVYCSLGTLAGFDKKKAILFLRQIRQISLCFSDFYFILSIGKGIEPDFLLPLPLNISVFKQVPQIHLLKYCNMMITHGGMNSITECIHQEVPMLVYPLDTKWDQQGNAARVLYHGLGLRGNMQMSTMSSILKNINRIRDNSEFYKNNLRKMKTRIEEEPDTAIDFINSLLR